MNLDEVYPGARVTISGPGITLEGRVEGMKDRWRLWVMFDPSMSEESHARLEQRRVASADRYAQRRRAA